LRRRRDAHILSGMTPDSFLDRITARLASDPGLAALFLGGSRGKGAEDRFSDIDLIALPKGDASGFAERWPGLLAEVAEIVFLRRTGQGERFLFNAITEDWLRCDLILVTREDFARRARGDVRPLIDPDGLHATLPETTAPAAPVPARVNYMIEEFLRVLGLLPVALGRGELVTAVQGAGMQRDALVQLMKLEAEVPPDGGLLHLSRSLPAADMAFLAALPALVPQEDSIRATHQAIAAAFLPRARRLAERIGLDWPLAFEMATRRHLHAGLGFEMPPSTS
jgi:hypothetical protein